MPDKQGYFSLVQFSEFPERGEYVNLGVVLFTGSPLRAWPRFAHTPGRAERAFHVSLGAYFRDIQEALQKRLEGSLQDGWTRDELERFIATRSGKLRLSPLRSVLVNDPVSVRDELFDRLVGEPPNQKRGPRSNTKLAVALRSRDADKHLFRPPPIDLPGGVRVQAPFAYRNGALNLINAVSLSGKPDKALQRASPHMIEGALLAEGTMLSEPSRLIMVGDDIENQEPRFVELIAKQMDEHNVRFYPMDRIDELVGDIRTHAQD